MRFLSEIRERLRVLLFRGREDRGLEEELAFHLEMAVEENLRRGMSPAEARRQAHLALGGVTRVRESTRDERGLRWLDALAQDVRYALRGIRRNPVFAVALVLTLGLGVGATSAMFGVVDALLLRPLPYAEPDRLVMVQRPPEPETGAVRPFVDLATARVWGERGEAGHVFETIFHHTRGTPLYVGGPEPLTLSVQMVSPSFEETLRVRPALGRGLDPADTRPGAEAVVLLGHGFWRTAFGEDPDVLGRVIELDGIGHRVIGVMPAGFKFPSWSTTDAWVPIGDDGSALGQTLETFGLVGRLAGDARMETAQARADAVARALDESLPREDGWGIRLAAFDPGRTSERLTRPIWFLAGAVALILIVATLNGINLLLVRSWSRTRELGVRVALGASRGRLIVQLVTESLILALAGGAVAAGLAFGALRLIQGIVPGSITFFAPYAIAIEGRALVFTFAVTVAVGLAIGLLPALLSTRTGGVAVGSDVSPHASRTPARSRIRRAIVVTEVALSVALLVGAGLLVNSFVRLVRVDPGFRLENVALMNLSMSLADYPTGAARMVFLRDVERRLEAVPGVGGVTTGGGGIPASRFTEGGGLEAEGETRRAGGQPGLVPMSSVSPDFFEVFDVGLAAGRAFTTEDAGTDNAIVDIDLARFLWGDRSPLGRRFRTADDRPWTTVVGVVGDLRLLGPDDRSGDFAILTPAADRASNYAALGIRTTGDPELLFPALRTALHELDPRQPISSLQTARARYAETIDMPRFLLVLMSILSGLALLLAAIGIYGVLAYGVVQRRFELAVRLALGARPASLSRRVLKEGLGLAALGAALGVAGALALSGLVRGLLYGVEPTDPLTVAAVVVVSLGVAALACWWPARRATRIDPVEVLKAN